MTETLLMRFLSFVALLSSPNSGPILPILPLSNLKS